MSEKQETRWFYLVKDLESIKEKISYLQITKAQIENEILELMPPPEKGSTSSLTAYGRRVSVTFGSDYSFIGLNDLSHDTIISNLPVRHKYEVDVKKAKAILDVGDDARRGILRKHLVIKPKKPSIKIVDDDKGGA